MQLDGLNMRIPLWISFYEDSIFLYLDLCVMFIIPMQQ